MAVNPKANIDVNNLSPSPDDEIIKYDEALKGFVSTIDKNQVETLAEEVAALEARAVLAGAGP